METSGRTTLQPSSPSRFHAQEPSKIVCIQIDKISLQWILLDRGNIFASDAEQSLNACCPPSIMGLMSGGDGRCHTFGTLTNPQRLDLLLRPSEHLLLLNSPTREIVQIVLTILTRASDKLVKQLL